MIQVISFSKYTRGQKLIDFFSVKPPLHRAATFVPPLCDHKNGLDAQWSPEPTMFFLLGDQWPTTVHPFCDHCDLSPLSDLWATDLLGDFVRLFWTCSKLHGDHGVHGDVWTSYVPPLNDQGNRSASLLPSTATWPVLWSYKGGTKVAAPV